MKSTWNPADIPTPPKFGILGALLALVRGLSLLFILLLGVILTCILRLVEVPIYRQHRPFTPFITQWVSRSAFAILGIRHKIEGERMNLPGAVVSNHASWLDIFALNARKRVYFVSKSEVAKWPGIGWLAKLAGTVFIARDPREARIQKDLFEARLLAGHKLLFFPEGTSTDGMRTLPFKSTLFQAFFNEKLCHKMSIQPVTVIYSAPSGQDERFYGWWGEMDFAGHLWQMLSAPRHGSVRVVYHQPVRVDAFTDRKTLAAHLENVVRTGMSAERQIKGSL